MIIDADTHVIEPPDLWSSRLPKLDQDSIPVARWDQTVGELGWYVGGQKLMGVGSPAMAGWHEYPPAHPKTWEEIDPALRDADARLKRMDELGIQAQVLYPNIGIFSTRTLMGASDPSIPLSCVRAYNDWLTEWSSADSDRLLAISILPFWDLDETLHELKRCHEAGHRGVSFSQNPAAFGLPGLADQHWNPLWATAQEMGVPINFHIGSSDPADISGASMPPEAGRHAAFTAMSVNHFLGNADSFARLACGGVFHRFPELNFVSVESGIGWWPYHLEALDWQWINGGVPDEHPEYDLLPSEYFKRQFYACFWFERETARFAIKNLGADCILYETDFPHPTCMTPGPATSAVLPREYLRDQLGDIPEDDLNKIIHGNAARLYRVGGA